MFPVRSHAGIRQNATTARVAYALALGFFTLALLTKPTVSIFPLALLSWRLLFAPPSDARPLGANDAASAGEKSLSLAVLALARHIWSLLPFFLLALGSGLLAMASERASMEVQATPDLPILDRPAIAASAIWFYVGKVLAPLNLTPIYPRWDVDISRAVWWLPVTGLVVATALVFRYRERIGKLSIWCMLNFLIPLLPAIGLLKFGYLRLSYVADHFLYLSMVGMAGLLAQSVTRLHGWVRPQARQWITTGACLFLMVCGLQTFLYGRAWQDSISLWTYNLKHDPLSWTAHNYLGHAFVTAGRPREAMAHFQATLNLKRKYIADHAERGRELERSGDTAGAQKERSRADHVRGTLAVAHHNLGNAFLFSEMRRQAIEQYRKAVALEPTMVKALTNLGVASIALGDLPEAVQSLTRALELSPDNFEALYNLGFALRFSGDRAGAERAFQRARVLRPDMPAPEFPEGEEGRSPSQ